jgi:hypothetical protein
MDEPNTREEDVSKMLLVERWSQDHNRFNRFNNNIKLLFKMELQSVLKEFHDLKSVLRIFSPTI